MRFQEVYGPIGAEFIHVHHLNPLSEAKGVRNVKGAEDLRPVCPNCHAMLHSGSGGTLLTIKELKKYMRDAEE